MLRSASQDQGHGLASSKKNLLRLPWMLQLIASALQPDTKPEQDDVNHHIDHVRVSRSNQCSVPALRIRKSW